MRAVLPPKTDRLRPPCRIAALAAFSAIAALLTFTLAPMLARAQEPAESSAPGDASQGETDSKDAPAETAASEPAPIDFYRDVQPILLIRCYRCHAFDLRSGGLRIDSLEHARAGGDSALPILGGDLETNELYRRVSSGDRSYRMPKNSDALPAEELEVLREWVEAGTPWPEIQGDAPQPRNFYEAWIEKLSKLLDRNEQAVLYARPFALAFMAAQILLLLMSRAKAAAEKGKPWQRLVWISRLAQSCSRREMVMAWCMMVLVIAIVVMRGYALRLQHDLAQSNAVSVRAESPWAKSIYGYPPRPIHPNHEKRLAGTYYRGNCERNPELFNNGNYLTAIFRVSLVDAEHRELKVGDTKPEGGVFVKLEMERAPGTTDVLYSPEMMASVMLSHSYFNPDTPLGEEHPVRLETLEPDWRWVAYVPCKAPDGNGTQTGIIYVSTGRVDEMSVSSQPHYGIVYELAYLDDSLTSDSDLWMNSFGNAAFSDPVPQTRLPYEEWFSDKPLPVITVENTKDPKLLGIEEYVRKGLISPEHATSPQEEGDKNASQPAEQESGETGE